MVEIQGAEFLFSERMLKIRKAGRRPCQRQSPRWHLGVPTQAPSGVTPKPTETQDRGVYCRGYRLDNFRQLPITTRKSEL